MTKRKLLSLVLSIIMLVSVFAVVGMAPSVAAEVTTGTVVGGTTVLNDDQATWKLHAAGDYFRLENKATGLFMTMDVVDGAVSLYQAASRGEGDGSQLFYLACTWPDGLLFVLMNVGTGYSVYGSDSGEILFSSDWYNSVPEGAQDNTYAQFCASGLTAAPVAGQETTFRSHGGGVYLQSGEGPLVTETTGTVVGGTTVLSEDQATWKLHSAGGYFRLENKATGLFMTMDAVGGNLRLYQAADRGDADGSQLFHLGCTWPEGLAFVLMNIGTLYSVYGSDTGEVLFSSDWANAVPDGAQNNSYAQFHAPGLSATPTDGQETTLCAYGGGMYLQSGEEGMSAPFEKQVLKSVSEDVSGVAFRFELNAAGVAVTDGSRYTEGSAKVTVNNNEYVVKRMGAVISNKSGEALVVDSTSKYVVNVVGAKLWSWTDTSASYAVRLINIPSTHLDTVIYARPYYVVDYNGFETVIYGDTVSSSYNAVVNG